jgi:hypothetical protein
MRFLRTGLPFLPALLLFYFRISGWSLYAVRIVGVQLGVAPGRLRAFLDEAVDFLLRYADRPAA